VPNLPAEAPPCRFKGNLSHSQWSGARLVNCGVMRHRRWPWFRCPPTLSTGVAAEDPVLPIDMHRSRVPGVTIDTEEGGMDQQYGTALALDEIARFKASLRGELLHAHFLGTRKPL
jgi:hypothetical protein